MASDDSECNTGNFNNAAKAKELISYIESYDVGSWVYEDSKETNRALMAEQYEDTSDINSSTRSEGEHGFDAWIA